jgi:hypothetical protein
MKRILFLTLILVIAIVIAGCDVTGGGSQDTDEQVISNINIRNAKALMVAPSNILEPSNNSDNVFIKVLSNGLYEEVLITNADGNLIENLVPTAIYDATSTYIIVVIDDVPYLINKTNGNTYDLSTVGTPVILRGFMGHDNEIRKSIYSDNLGNIYYLSEGIVKKIDVSNPDAITAINYTPDIYNIATVNEFSVDNEGNVLFTYTENAQDFAKIKTANGALTNVEKPVFLAFTGYDGNFYYQPCSNSGNTAEGILQKITINSNYDISYSDCDTFSINGYAYGQSYRWLYFEDKIIIVKEGKRDIIYNSSGPLSSKNIDFLSSTNLKILRSSTSHYYAVTNQGEIYKVDPSNNDSQEILINSNLYDFYKLSVTNDNEVTFYALRLSDSKKVIGHISENGNVSITVDTIESDVILLQKVN